MREAEAFFSTNGGFLKIAAITWVAILFLVGLFRWSRMAKIERSLVRHEEKWQSGRSERSFWTKWLSANNCLNIKFLDTHLVIRPEFPFDCFLTKGSGFFQKIRYDAVTDCRIEQRYWQKYVRLTFQAETGSESFVFTAKAPDKVLAFCARRG